MLVKMLQLYKSRKEKRNVIFVCYSRFFFSVNANDCPHYTDATLYYSLFFFSLSQSLTHIHIYPFRWHNWWDATKLDRRIYKQQTVLFFPNCHEIHCEIDQSIVKIVNIKSNGEEENYIDKNNSYLPAQQKQQQQRQLNNNVIYI